MLGEQRGKLVNEEKVVSCVSISKVVPEKGWNVEMIVLLGGMQVGRIHMSLHYIKHKIV